MTHVDASLFNLDPKFLHFFFTRLRANSYTDRPYALDFPYVSLCGRERNFVRCADVPFVLTRLLDDQVSFECAHIASSRLLIPFEPEKIYVKPDTGRLYYPIPPQFYTGIALIKDAIAEQLSSHLQYDDGPSDVPVGLAWQGKVHRLTRDSDMEKRIHEHSRFEI